MSKWSRRLSVGVNLTFTLSLVTSWRIASNVIGPTVMVDELEAPRVIDERRITALIRASNWRGLKGLRR